MDFTFLPKTTYREKAFVRYRIRAKEVFESPVVIHNGFYYIGKNPANIEKLVKLFKRGYASDSIENARAELKRSTEQEKNTIPEVIFCESSFDFTSVKNFVQFLNGNSIFAGIPFIMDSSNLCDIEMGMYKKHMLADDIIEIEKAEQNALISKVRFLNKVKTKVSRNEKQSEGRRNTGGTTGKYSQHFEAWFRHPGFAHGSPASESVIFPDCPGHPD